MSTSRVAPQDAAKNRVEGGLYYRSACVALGKYFHWRFPELSQDGAYRMACKMIELAKKEYKKERPSHA